MLNDVAADSFPAGWYPDPWRAAPMRWWDGYRWTDRVGGGPLPGATGIPPFDLVRAQERERRLARWAVAALIALAVVVVCQCVWDLEFGHAWQHMIPDDSNADGPMLGPIPRWAWLTAELSGLLGVGMMVAFLMWQHSAATVARGLGFPSRTSPAFGVGSWFIPVMGLWAPYHALADTLSPDHPLRGRCIWAWLSYIGSNVANVVAFLVALVSTAGAIVVMAVAVVLTLVAVVLGCQLVQAVAEDHRSRLAVAQRA